MIFFNNKKVIVFKTFLFEFSLFHLVCFIKIKNKEEGISMLLKGSCPHSTSPGQGGSWGWQSRACEGRGVGGSPCFLLSDAQGPKSGWESLSTWLFLKVSMVGGRLCAWGWDWGLLCRAEPWEVGEGDDEPKPFWRDAAGPLLLPLPVFISVWSTSGARCVVRGSDFPRAAILPAALPFSSLDLCPSQARAWMERIWGFHAGRERWGHHSFIPSFVHCVALPCRLVQSLGTPRWAWHLGLFAPLLGVRGSPEQPSWLCQKPSVVVVGERGGRDVVFKIFLSPSRFFWLV